MVEVQLFDKTFHLGVVTQSTSGDAEQVSILLSNGLVRNLRPIAIKYHYNDSVHKKDGSIDLFAISQTEREARALLKANIHKLEAITNAWKQTADKDPLSSDNFLYEGDVAHALFQTKHPTPAQLYAIHLYLYSFTSQFGKDFVFSTKEVAGIKEMTPSAGPYYFRSAEDVQLVTKVQQIINENPSLCMGFQQLVSSLLASDMFKAECWKQLLKPIYEPLLAVVRRACHVNYVDADSPLMDCMYRLLYPTLDADAKNNVMLNKLRLVMEESASMDSPPLSTQEALDEVSISQRSNAITYNRLMEKCGLALRKLPFSNGKVPQSLLKASSTVASNNGGTSSQSIFYHGRREVGEVAFAIDSPETVEVDDAVSLRVDGNGDQWIEIHVADPTVAIPFGSPLAELVKKRVSSIYMPNVNFSMMPNYEGIQYGLDHCDRALTFSAKLDPFTGDILDWKVSKTVLKDVKRVSYDDAASLISHTPGSALHTLHSSLTKHHQWRLQQGKLNVDIPKMDAKVNHATGSISLRPDSDDRSSRFMVSEAMVLAGRIAAMFSQEHGLPVPFRYQMDPSKMNDSLEYQHFFNRVTNPATCTLYDRLKYFTFITAAAIDLKPRRHWAMGLDTYAKATSPIRRYFDMLLHWQIHSVLSPLLSKTLSKEMLEEIIPPAYRHEQYLKRLQKEANRLWTIRFIEQQLAKNGPIPVKATIMDYYVRRNMTRVFLEDYSLMVTAELPGGSALEIGACSVPLEIIHMDPNRCELRTQ